MVPPNPRNNQNNNDGDSAGNLRKNRPACAACKKQRKGCAQTCLLAPYFPHTKIEQFSAVHELFGLSNVQRMLRTHQEHARRQEFVDSLIWNAQMWKDDLVLGPYGAYLKLKHENDILKSIIDSQLQQQHQQEQQQQQQHRQQQQQHQQQQQQAAIVGGHMNYGVPHQQNINQIEGSWRYVGGIFMPHQGLEPRVFRGGEETDYGTAAIVQQNHVNHQLYRSV